MKSPVRFSQRALIALIVTVGVGTLVAFAFVGCTTAMAQCVGRGQARVDDAEALAEVSLELAPNYFTYSESGVEEALAAGQRVVLYFWAPWCSSCSSVDFELQDKKVAVPLGVKMFRVNYDQARELRQKYSVTIQHSFVQIDKNHQSLQHWVGGEMKELEEKVI